MKQLKRFNLNIYPEWDTYANKTIHDIRKDLDDAELMGATHTSLYTRSDGRIIVQFYSERYETDDEYTLRLKEEHTKLEKDKERELKLLAELQKKYS